MMINKLTINNSSSLLAFSSDNSRNNQIPVAVMIKVAKATIHDNKSKFIPGTEYIMFDMAKLITPPTKRPG